MTLKNLLKPKKNKVTTTGELTPVKRKAIRKKPKKVVKKCKHASEWSDSKRTGYCALLQKKLNVDADCGSKCERKAYWKDRDYYDK